MSISPTSSVWAAKEPSPDDGSPAEVANEVVLTFFDLASERPVFVWATMGLIVALSLWFAFRRASSVRAWLDGVWSFQKAISLLVSAMAAGVAWFVADLAGSSLAAFASAAALITSQVAVRGSARMGFEVLAGSVAALVIASFAISHFGASALTITSVTVVASIAGLLLARESSEWIVTTAIIAAALGAGLSDVALVDRILATMVGVIVGVLFSFLAHPSRTVITSVRSTFADYSAAIARLLTLCAGSSDEEAIRSAQDELSDAAAEARAALKLAKESLPGSKAKQVSDFEEKLLVLTRQARQAQGLAQNVLFASSHRLRLSDEVKDSMLAAAGAVQAFGSGKEYTQALALADVAHEHAERVVRDSMLDTNNLIFSGSVLSQMRVITGRAPNVELADTQPVAVIEVDTPRQVSAPEVSAAARAREVMESLPDSWFRP